MTSKKPEQVRHRTKERDDGENNHNGSDNLVNDADACSIKDTSNLIHQPRQAVPPQQGASYDTGKTYEHLERAIGTVQTTP